jgi:hypothetical protein
MAGVACTLVTKGWSRGVMYSRVALDALWSWKIRSQVDIYRSETCICHVVRKPQLGKSSGSNRRYSTRKES